MAKKISGITVAIDCDATGVSKGLKDINNNVIQTQRELKQLNSALKLDPKNTELLREKQKALKEQIEQTEEKLRLLKKTQDSVNEAYKKNDINREQYVAFQKELVQTEKNLKSLRKELQKTASEGLEKFGKSMQEAGDKVSNVGQNLMGLSATVGAIGVAGLKVATDFEAGMSQVQAITQATEEEFDALRNQAIELGASTAFSSAEVADAMTEMAKAGWTTEDILSGLSGVLSATSASGEQLGTVATIVADALTGFGEDASQAQRVADLLTQSANSGTIGITDLGESFKYIAPVAKALNISIEDATTAISAMSTAGIKGSSAGTALRTMLANLAKPTKAMKQAMNELNIEVTNSDGSFKSLDEIIAILRGSMSELDADQQAYYATVLAGKEGMSGMLSLVTMTQEEYDKLGASMDNCQGIADETASVMQDNLQAKLEQLFGALESLAIVIADNILPALTDFIEWLTGLVEKLTECDPWMQKLILVLGGVAIAIGPVLMLVGNLMSGIGNLTTMLAPLMAKLGLAGGSIGGLVAPILGTIGALALFGTAFVHLWNTSEEFRTNITNTIQKLMETLMAIIQPWIDNMEHMIDGFLVFVEGLVQAFSALVSGDWKSLWEGIKKIVSGALEFIKAFVDSALKSVVKIIEGVGTLLYNAGSAIFDLLWQGIQSVWTAITEFFTVTIPEMFTSISSINLFDIGSEIIGSLWSGAINIWGEVSSWFSEKMAWISDKISWLWGKKAEADSINISTSSYTTTTSKKTTTTTTKSSGTSKSLLLKAVPKHKTGLSYVPYDGYLAELHEGERVLTKNENQRYSGGASGGVNVTQNIYVPTENPRELERQAKRNLVKLGLGV